MKKNILFVIPSIRKGGGAEKVAFTIINRLENDKKYNIFLSTFYTYEKSYKTRTKNIQFNENRPRGPFGKLIRLFTRLKKIKNISIANNIATIVSFTEDANFPVLLTKMFSNLNCKIIISVHSSPITRRFSYKILIRLIYNKADKIVTVSKGIRDILIDKFNIPSSKLLTIYNPIDIDKIKMESEENVPTNYSITKDAKFFTFVSLARLAKIKNHAGTIEAFSNISNKHPEARLLIIGNGPEKNHLQSKLEKLNLKDRVFLIGLQENPFPYLKNCDCFIFNSLSEGFGVSIIEALSCGLPIISSDCKFGPREILCSKVSARSCEDMELCSYGILFPINNITILSKAMDFIMNNKEVRNNFKKTAPKRASDFRIENIISKWGKIF